MPAAAMMLTATQTAWYLFFLRNECNCFIVIFYAL